MPFIDSSHQRAAYAILLLAVGLVVALSPYATGLIGAIVLYVVFAPLNTWFRHYSRPGVAAALVVVIALLLIVVPSVPLTGAIVAQAQDMAAGVVESPIIGKLSTLRIGRYNVGSQLAALGENVVAWLGGSAFGLIGTATRFVLNLTIALFGLYFLSVRPHEVWSAVRPYIPFSATNAEKLKNRFRDVTTSTMIGTGLTAVIQGALVVAAFMVLELDNALFWGVLTVVFAILPVVGSGLVWGPAALSLYLSDRPAAAIGMALWGGIVVSNVDTVIRPIVYRRWAQIHPFVTLVGALAGIRFFGILGLLIGPLAVSYFFELIRMYREEYLEPSDPTTPVNAAAR